MQHIIDKWVLLLETRNGKTRVDPQCGCALRLKSQIHIQDTQKTLDKQGRADEQQAGEGELRDRQSVAEPAMPATATPAAARVLQPFTKLARQNLEARAPGQRARP